MGCSEHKIINLWCLHGAVGEGKDWNFLNEKNLPYIIRRVNLWRFLDCCPMTLWQCAAALNAEVSAVEGKHILLGYSMGGRIALHSLLENAQLFDAAIIVSAHPGLDDEVEKSLRRSRDAEWGSKALSSDWQDFLTEWNAQAVLQGGNKNAAHVNYRKEIARSFIDWSLGAQDSLWEKLPEIQIPVLWITGRDDQKFTQIAEQAVSLMSQAQHKILPAGHRVPWQAEGEFLQAANDFIAAVS